MRLLGEIDLTGPSMDIAATPVDPTRTSHGAVDDLVDILAET